MDQDLLANILAQVFTNRKCVCTSIIHKDCLISIWSWDGKLVCILFQDIAEGFAVVPLLGLVETIAIGRVFGKFFIDMGFLYLDIHHFAICLWLQDLRFCLSTL